VHALSLISLLTGLAYLAAGACLAIGFYQARVQLRRVGIVLAVLGLVGHAWVMWARMASPVGWDINFVHSLGLASLIIVIVLLLTSLRSRMLEAGIIALPGAALCVWLMWLANPDPLILGQLSARLELHIFSSLLAYGLLSIAAINAILLAIQDHLLRHPRPLQQLELLPPLTVLETLLFQLVLAGWLVLSLSLLSGLMFVDDLMAQHLVHKTVLSILSWLLFGALLAGRWWFGWRGRRAVNWTLAAMLVLVLAYFGSKLVLEVFLDRTWTSPLATTTLITDG
jgi:ABC-type uncharacterized transport system permease subunit